MKRTVVPVRMTWGRHPSGSAPMFIKSSNEPPSYCKTSYQQGVNGSEEMAEETAGIKKYCQPRALYQPYLEGGDIQFYFNSATWTALQHLVTSGSN